MTVPTPELESRRTESATARHGLLTLLFTDLVGSTRLKQQFGDRDAVALIESHHALVRSLLGQFESGEEIKTAGDSFFLMFAKPSDAVQFSLLLQAKLREFNSQRNSHLRDRIGIHLGEVVIQQEGTKGKDLQGLQVDICARVMSLAQGDQILLTRAVFDNARQALKGVEGLTELAWLNHGLYALSGVEEPMDICEVGETGRAVLRPPSDSEKARRYVSPESESVSGWRPGLEQTIPGTHWILHERLGEGGFGEVWLARHKKLGQQRVFKFCFHADRVRSLKREVTLFRLLKERVGEHPHIVALRDVNFDEPPHYVEMDYVEGKDLKKWCEEKGGASQLSLECRIELIAQAAAGLQAAHEAGIVHRDIKPGNILVSGKPAAAHSNTAERSGPKSEALTVQLTDFGIGQVLSEECLAGMTRAGFTQTIAVQSSSSHTGTQMYMAPELLAGTPASPQSDIYSLGLVLYQLAVGDFRRPISADWPEDITDPLLRDDLRQCLAGDPKKRLATAAELARRLRALPERKLELARQEAELAARVRAAYRRGLMRATAGALIILAALAWLSLTAIQQRNRARAQEAENHLLLHAAEINLAQRNIEVGRIAQAKELLDLQPPEWRGFEWRFLKQFCLPDYLVSLTGHKGLVQNVAISPDGQILASGNYGRMGAVHLWDMANRRTLRDPLLPKFRVRSVAFSRDGTRLAASGDSLNAVSIWDVNTWTELFSLTDFSDRVERVAFSPDGRWLAAACVDAENASLWDLTTQQRLATFRGARTPRGCVAFSPDGQWLAFGRGDNTVRLVRLTDYTELASFAGHTSIATYLDFSPDSQLLASASSDGDVRLWEIPTGGIAGVLTGKAGHVTSVSFSPSGKQLATSHSNGTLKLWEVASRNELATLRGHAAWVNNVTFSPDETWLASGSDDGTIKLWDARRSASNYLFPSDATPIRAPRPSPDSQSLATQDPDGSLAVRDIKTQAVLARFHEVTTAVVDSAWFDDSQRLAIFETNGAVRIWDSKQNRVRRTFDLPHPPRGETDRLVAADGKLYFIDRGGAVIVCDSDSGAQSVVPNLPPLAQGIYRGFNSRIVVALRQTNAIVLRDLANSSDVAQFHDYPSDLPLPRFSPNFQWAVQVTHNASTLSVWQAGRPGPPGLIKSWRRSGGGGVFSTPVFSPDHRYLATGSEDQVVRIWDLQTLQTLRSLNAHSGWIIGLAFSPDGRVLASSSNDASVKLWSVASGRELLTMPGQIAPYSRVQFTPDGNTLFSLGEDELLRLWRAPSADEIDTAPVR